MRLKTRLLSFGVMAAVAAAVLPSAALASETEVGSETLVHLDIPAGPAAAGLNTLATQAGLQLFYPFDAVRGRSISPVKGDFTRDEAIQQMAAAAGLRVAHIDGQTVTLAPQSGSAAGDGAEGTVQALIVTAQKREEDIQDVPIAISAFTQEDLTRSQVAGGPDLVTQVPNFTFTKTNFSSYSIQIRGIGTQAISATTDPAVAVAFNNTPFIRNRFFEQEFYDLERVEVLRGPQGTLYGRNATAGVVNIISAKPKFRYEAKLSGDASNFNSTRFEGMVNIPIAEDKVALRLAGAWTKRDGYATNQLTGNPIDGRDLWSTRLSLRVQPTDRLNVNLIWEHFQEDDDRLRSGKQLCKKDVVTEIAGVPVEYFQSLPDRGQGALLSGVQATFSQGCTRESFYDPSSFQTPNGLMLPYYYPLSYIGLAAAKEDPYVSTVQSRDLRVIEASIDPDYRAKSDLAELQISFDLTDNLTLQLETGYNTDTIYSLEDYNRFNTAPGAWDQPGPGTRPGLLLPGPNGGIFCDPQLGCSDRLIAVDVSTAKSRQFAQEFRVASNFTGPFNFSIGGNFLRYDTEDKYYVFINSLTLDASSAYTTNLDNVPYVPGVSDNTDCMLNAFQPGDPNDVYSVVTCNYIDPNPINAVNDQGHNYFLSKNPYKLISYAIFGEAYYQITPTLKLTAGLRWTVDKKDAARVPTWVLASQSFGYPVAEVVQQEWREPSGRLTLDWKPELSFTDETLLYASYAHGYKAGGANPPGYVRVYYANFDIAQQSTAESATRPKTFAPEFVDAFEVGSKNTLLDGRATLNLAGFYYDYQGYQISEIVDRSAFNRNFDATVWGIEIESDWRPTENLRIGFKGGYERTRIADGMKAVDLMDRTAGHAGWQVVKPFPTYTSNCILPDYVFVQDGVVKNPGGASGGNPGACEIAYAFNFDPVTYAPYGEITDPNQFPWPFTGYTNYPGFDPSTAPNNGEGFDKQLGGNELPNAPHWTATILGDYVLPLPNEWLMTLHTDVHWQSQSWWRVFNDHAYDKLHPYFTMNLAAIFTNEDAGWNIMAYIKNVTDETAITGAFLNSDDTGLTTNVFLTEPRLYGLRVTKAWSGGSTVPWLEPPHGPAPLTVEIGGQIQRQDAPTTPVQPGYASAFAAPLDVNGAAQGEDLDWGDGREVKVTYRPGLGPWSVSGQVRYGKTNANNRRFAEQFTEPTCIFGSYFSSLCEFYGSNPKYVDFVYLSQPNHAEAIAYDREEHTLADFAVGREAGLGGLSHSTVSAGVRYADFKSTTKDTLRGVPDWVIPEGLFLPGYLSTHTAYNGEVDANRRFKGAGPVVAWDAALPLLALDTGRLDVDWSVQGGVLFGTQNVAISSNERSAFFEENVLAVTGAGWSSPPVSTATLPPLDIHRSHSASVPVAGASLGLSYEVQRIRIGAGYRWERYYNVIDGGFAAHESYDRTIDGPYLKVSLGFGG